MSERRARLKEIVVDRMNLKIAAGEIGDEQALFGDGDGSLGLDSIDALDLVVGIYEEFEVEIQESDMSVFHNVATLDGFIEERLAQRVVA
jgi:acyl carrier protein